jgi:hypothetical protein
MALFKCEDSKILIILQIVVIVIGSPCARKIVVLKSRIGYVGKDEMAKFVGMLGGQSLATRIEEEKISKYTR